MKFMVLVKGVSIIGFNGLGRSAIAAILAIMLIVMLVAPEPAQAGLGIGDVLQAAQGVVGYINNTIGSLLNTGIGLLGEINKVEQAFSDLWQKVVYPVALIASAQAMVRQIIAQFTGVAMSINNINVLSATLRNPATLESILRNGSITDFSRLDQAFRQTYQPIPPAGNISTGDQQRVDMDDALAMDTLKALKASDGVVQQTLQAAQIIENEAVQDAPGSAAYLTGAGLIAGVENQASIQRMIAAELRQEAGALAHGNALRKRYSDMSSQFHQDSMSAFK
jgi:hypothetical protein